MRGPKAISNFALLKEKKQEKCQDSQRAGLRNIILMQCKENKILEESDLLHLLTFSDNVVLFFLIK